MKHTMRIITFLMLAVVVGAGQAWAEDVVQFGHITYNGTAANDGGTLEFYMSSKVFFEKKKYNLITLTNGESAALTSDDLEAIYDDNGQIVGYKLFIMATPAVGHRLPQPDADGTVSFIQAEVVTSAQQAPSRRNAPDPTLEVGQTLPVKFYGYYSGNSFGDDPATEYYGLYYVVMPADANLSVSITANFPEVTTTTVKYIDPTKTGDAQNCSVTAYVLDGTEARLGYGSFNYQTEHETWYVCNKDLTYTNGLEFYGKVHLILADGKTMTYDGTERFIYSFGNLDIYGQGGTTEGAINAKSTEENCINVTGYLTINGGNISAESTNTSNVSHYGIKGETLITINGGTVNGKSNVTGIGGCNIYINGGIVNGTGTHEGISTASGTMLTITGGHVCGIGDKFGMRGMKGLIITGGQIEATSGTGDDEFGIYSDHGDIILGWTNADDYIKANSYHCGTEGKIVKTADGQRLVAFNAATGTAATTIVSGTVADVTTLAGKTLKPLEGNYVSINSGDFTFSGTTSTTSPFTITTGEGENTTTTHYYIYKENNTATLSYTGNDFVQVTGLPEGTTLAAVTNEPMQRTFTMPATDVALTATAVTGLTATAVTYDGTARTPEIKQGDDVFAPENYTIDYKLGDEAVTAADVKNAGTYTCTLTGVGQYIGTVSDIDFTINKKQTTIAVVVDNANTIVAGDDARITVTMTPKIDTWTQLNIGEKSYSVAVVNGEGHFVFTNLFENTYSVTASFLENDNYVGSTSDPNYSIAVSKVKTAIKISFDETDMTANTKVVTVGEPVTVYVDLYTVPSDWDGDFAKASPFNSDAIVTVTARLSWKTDYNDHYTLGLVDGHGSITFSHLPADERHYNIFAAYAGDDNYQKYLTTDDIGGTLKLTVNKTETTIGVSVTSPVIAK